MFEGRNLQPLDWVQFDGTPAEFRSISATRFEAIAPPGVVPPVASTDGVHFDRIPLPEERAALLAYLRKL